MKKRNIVLLGLLAVFLTTGIIAGCGGSKGFELTVTADGSPMLSTTKLIFSFSVPTTGFSADNITTLEFYDGSPEPNTSIVKKGTLSGSEQEYVLPISGFSSSGWLNVTVEMSGTIVTHGVTIYYSPAQDGIYIGIIKFAGEAEAINLNDNYYPGDNNNETNSGAPVLLDQNLKTRIENILWDYRKAYQSGTAIYYAVHKALANLKSNENRYPANLDSVYVITFTDGLDNASTGQSLDFPIEDKPFDTISSYVTYVKDQIANRKIAGKEITAYSIGVRGNDVTDIPGFQTALKNIASSGKDKELTNFNDIESTFNEIAEGLIQGSSFTLTTTLLESGTIVRMTFDIDKQNPTAGDAASSTKYIEGTINRSGNTYTFNDITYAGGISSDAGTGPITGTRSGTTVNFLFSNITGYNSTDSLKTKQWTKAPGVLNWNINSEYSSAKTDSGTSVIYLVLDCSTSMSDNNISQIREAVKSFIDKIYTSRYGDGF